MDGNQLDTISDKLRNTIINLKKKDYTGPRGLVYLYRHMIMIKRIKICMIVCFWLMFGWISMAQRWANQGLSGLTSIPWVAASIATTGAASNVLITKTIQNFINRVLAILAFIALILLLYWGFMMLIAAGDEEKYSKGFTILKQVSLWLVFIGLARIVVSMIFRVIAKIT